MIDEIKKDYKVRLKGSFLKMTALRPSFDDETYGFWTCGWLCRKDEKWKTGTFSPSVLEIVERVDDTPPEPPVAIGDVVKLMGGHCLMVVAEVLPEEAVCYWHDAGGEFHSRTISYDLLTFSCE